MAAIYQTITAIKLQDLNETESLMAPSVSVLSTPITLRGHQGATHHFKELQPKNQLYLNTSNTLV